jgi:hypothetical protein
MVLTIKHMGKEEFEKNNQVLLPHNKNILEMAP